MSAIEVPIGVSESTEIVEGGFSEHYRWQLHSEQYKYICSSLDSGIGPNNELVLAHERLSIVGVGK